MAEARRRSEYVTVETLDVRVTALEEGLHGVRKDMADVTREIQSNTALTEQIQGSVETIVDAVKWLSTTKRLLLVVFAGVTCTSGAIVAAVSALHALGILP
jgi:hypothetical protein